jgi:hypothetical protein
VEGESQAKSFFLSCKRQVRPSYSSYSFHFFRGEQCRKGAKKIFKAKITGRQRERTLSFQGQKTGMQDKGVVLSPIPAVSRVVRTREIQMTRSEQLQK